MAGKRISPLTQNKKTMNQTRRRLLFALLLGLISISSAYAQQTKTTVVSTETVRVDTLSKGADGIFETATVTRKVERTELLPPFTYTVRPSVSLVQTAFRDWVGSGGNSIAWTTSLEAFARYDFDPYVWTNRLNLSYGQNKTEEQGARKTIDLIDFETNLRYGNSILKPEFVATLQTQFAPGYDYGVTGEPQVSAFFDPAYLVQSIGLAYKETDNFEASFGVAFREIITSKYNSYSDDPDTKKVEKIDFKTGVRASALWTAKVMENIEFNSRLQLFSAFESLDTWDVNSRNMLRMKINRFLQAHAGLTFFFQKNSSDRLQIQETFELTFSYPLTNL
jgi:hypothetical protein